MIHYPFAYGLLTNLFGDLYEPNIAPWKINMELENHLFEKENHLNQTLDFWVQNVNFQGCIVYTLQETNISPKKGTFEDDFPFPQVGYVNSLEGNL